MSMGILPGPTFIAGGSIAPFRIVKLDSTARQVLQCSATTDACFGVAQPNMKGAPGVAGSDTTVAAATGDVVRVDCGGNVAKVEAGAAITAGVRVNTDTSGRAVVVPAGAGNYNVLGFALEAAANAGDLIDVYIFPHRDTH